MCVRAHEPKIQQFLGGGRSCIGFKFSRLEMKVVLAILLSSFRFSLAKGESASIFWNRSGVAYPTAGPNGKKPNLPLTVEVSDG
ncbi:uncharacterized protein PHACADRAFT_205085 [Phanerochaete carnosa HHB-10118-sp]|uniref:Cytochrome P450 n=1 Tax=Phanerochaete carnosa (strain HHB-10118-sp) TaxID=650164 RepID=K5WHP5_PHACS|nr:uncharacterized protein PHACADRAFT_205085 [Phanerochaete carnosa HHB-10118-sp]EKM58850.1 hypothetical protein PHACADRAFT_205085 [Phanerochaete carnosa HHB-10118-sp]